MNIKIDNISFRYNKHELILKDLSIAFSKGQIWGILGHNGAGKTTLARLILGLLPPCSGNISFDFEKSISYLPESNGIYEKLTCYENLVFRGEIFGLNTVASKKRADHLLEELNIVNKKWERAAFLSHGMKKRLGLGCALMNPGNLIILDEPTNGLDPESLEIVRNIISSFKGTDTIILIICHDLETVQQVCNNIVILQNGEKIYVGAMDDDNKESIKDIYLKVVKGHEEYAD